MSALPSDIARWPRYGARMERWMRFQEWADARYIAPHWQDVVAEFGCSRASAYRWIAFWKARKWAQGAQA